MPHRTFSVLVLEDHPDQRALLADYLSLHGGRVKAVGSLEEARQATGAEGPFDLYVMDLELPDGVSTALFEDGTVPPGRSVLVSAAHELPPIPAKVLFVPKPASLQRLDRAIADRLGPGWKHPPVAERGSIPPAAPSPSLELDVYVSCTSSASARLVARLERILSEPLAAHPHVTLIDVDEPAGREAADRANVYFTPAVHRVLPEPTAWLVGDLGDDATARHLLGLSPNPGIDSDP